MKSLLHKFYVLLAVFAMHLPFAGWVQASNFSTLNNGPVIKQSVTSEIMFPCKLEAPVSGTDLSFSYLFFSFFENDEDPDNEGLTNKSLKSNPCSTGIISPIFSVLPLVRFQRCGTLILPPSYRRSGSIPVFLRIRVLRL
jgi:hypothetical protein